MGEFLSRIAAAYLERRNDATEMRFMGRAMILGDLSTMDTNEDNKVSQAEFLSYMLVAMQKVEREDVDEVLALFQDLDVSGTGYIEMNDLKEKYQFDTTPGTETPATVGNNGNSSTVSFDLYSKGKDYDVNLVRVDRHRCHHHCTRTRLHELRPSDQALPFRKMDWRRA